MAEISAIPTPDEKARYEALKKDLLTSLPKKRAIDKQLALIEFQIYNLEASYLTETAAHSGGNIIQGFEGYLKNQTATRKKYEVSDQDRVFSNSSLTYPKSLDISGEGDESTPTNDDYKQSSVGPTTVVLPPAPKNQELSLQAKRARDKEYQRRKRASASLRSTGESEEDASVSSRRATKRARMVEDD
ncbi:NuA4-domain-containing protein [Coprinopsis marcescibilis]|uniref:Chromatin modification-related protein EAF6 n=1 Tax=Coprinopsis marcescibilis TaxID=230819 RepID=A0A5C3KJQ0_COPMA|nr:NuA4-domain-containing protein [Coprinopsis marcescibilis]